MAVKTKTPTQIVQMLGQMKAKRANFENVWQGIGDYVFPTHNDIQVVRTPGEPKYNDLLDTSAQSDSELLAGALHSMLTNPSGYFFGLSTGSVALDQNDNVRKWVQAIVRLMHDTLNNSNFQTEVHEYYMELVNFGTGPLSMEEDDETDVRFAARHIREIFVQENSKGQIDTVFRCYKMDLRGLVDDFGEKALPPDLYRMWEAGKCDREYEVVHAVYPKKKGEPGQKIVSQYVLAEQKITLKKGGFNELPYIISRWTKAAGESYGRGPGEKALPPAKLMNAMMETTIKGGQKTVDPPLQAPDDGFMTGVDTTPAGISYYRAGSDDRITPIFSDARIDYGIQLIEMVRGQSREAFYVDQLKLREGPQMTATEVSERVEQALRFLGPMLGRQNSEFLNPLVTRLYAILERKGKIPPAPQELKGIPLKPVFTSVMAMSQRMSEAQNIQRTFQGISPLMALDPNVRDNFDTDAGARYISKLYNLPQEMLRNQKDMQTIRQQRAQAAQEQQNAMNSQATADSASKVIGAAGKVGALQSA